MGIVLRRLLASFLLLSLMAMVGGLIGMRLGTPVLGTWAGAVCGLVLAGVRDARRAGRLVAWLRGNLEGEAPRDGELWGEMAYRTERALRQREKALLDERQRLGEFLRAIEASPNGVILLDADEQIVWINQNGAVHLGLDPQRDLGQRITNLVRSPAFVTGLQARGSRVARSRNDHDTLPRFGEGRQNNGPEIPRCERNNSHLWSQKSQASRPSRAGHLCEVRA